MLGKIIKFALLAIFVIVAAGVTNAYFFAPELEQQGEVVAYRGGGSLVDYEKLGATGCTATSLLESGIDTVENTLPAVAASVAAGIDVIHLNVHRTSDNQLVVFHDWTLDCATNAIGPVHEYSSADLERVDAGYGYTFDDGMTFPFREKGYRISKLEEFFNQYPDHKFWLNLKNNDEHSFDILYTFMSNMPSNLFSNTVVITSSRGMAWFRDHDLSIRLASVESVKSCGIHYLLVGWAGVVPVSCRNQILLIPPSMKKYFWGYPNGLAARLQKNGSAVYLWSTHKPIDPTYADVLTEGVGVVTSDINFIKKARSKKTRNLDALGVSIKGGRPRVQPVVGPLCSYEICYVKSYSSRLYRYTARKFARRQRGASDSH